MTGATPARRQRRTDFTRTRLLDAALEVFCARGYDAASLTEITTRADLGAGTLYLHFKDKRSLYEGMVRREGLSVRESWLEARADHPPSPGDLEAEVRLFCEVVLEAWRQARPDLMRLVLLDGPALETWLAGDVGRVIAPVLAEHLGDAELLAGLVVGALLAAGRHRLTSVEPIRSDALTETVVAFCVGGIAAERARTARPSKQARKR